MDSIAEKRRHRFQTTKLVGHLLGANRTQVAVEKFRRYCGHLPLVASLASHLMREAAIHGNTVRMPYRQKSSTRARPTSEARHPRYADVDRTGGRLGQVCMP